MGITKERRNAKRAAQETPVAPIIYRTDKGWRVDTPDGDFCYQPSEQFAISYARRWQVAHNMGAPVEPYNKRSIYNPRVHVSE